MASVGTGAVRIIDNDNDVVGVTGNALDVHIKTGTSTIDIGDVSLLLGGTAASVDNGSADATTLRVTIASDSTGILTVDSGVGILTVGGTVTANLSATDNAVLDTIYTNTQNIATTNLVLTSALYGEDIAHVSADKGTFVLAVRRDVPIAGNADGDYSSLNISAQGGLYVEEIVHGILDTFAMIDVDNAAEALSDTIGTITDCAEIMLQADESNSGYVMVGDGDVADNRGIKLNPGDTIILDIDDTRVPSLWGSAADQNVRCMLKRRTI